MADIRPGLFGAAFGAGFLLFTILLVTTTGPLAVVAITLVGILTIAALVAWLQSERDEVRFQTVVAPDATVAPEVYMDYDGDVHDVIDIEGIGPVFAERLNASGVETTARLCFLGAEEAARIADVPLKTAQKWIAMAQLVKVKGIGKQYAEALVRGGVLDIESLQNGDAELIAGQVSDYLAGLESNVLGQKVTPRRVTGWQRAAASMRPVELPVPTA